MTQADSHEYTVCDLASGPQECVEPPDYSKFGYDSWINPGTRILLSKVTYVCEPPKVGKSYTNGFPLNEGSKKLVFKIGIHLKIISGVLLGLH